MMEQELRIKDLEQENHELREINRGLTEANTKLLDRAKVMIKERLESIGLENVQLKQKVRELEAKQSECRKESKDYVPDNATPGRMAHFGIHGHGKDKKE